MNKKSRNFEVLQIRSVGAVIHDGYLLFLDQFRLIFRASWLVALIYALISGVASSVIVKLLPEFVFLKSLDMTEQLYQTTVLMTVIPLVVSIATTLLFAVGFSLLNSHQQTTTIPAATHWYGILEKKSLMRTITTWLCLLAVTVFALLLSGMQLYFIAKHLSPIAAVLLYAINFFVYLLAVPLLIMLMIRYVLSDKTLTAQRLLPRFWGSTIMVSIVVFIITQLLSMITELPTNILTIANIQSQMGALKGDAVGMPDYMTWMNIVAFTLAGFIKAYVLLSAIFPLYYLNGSIDAQENEREEMSKRFKNL